MHAVEDLQTILENRRTENPLYLLERSSCRKTKGIPDAAA